MPKKPAVAAGDTTLQASLQSLLERQLQWLEEHGKDCLSDMSLQPFMETLMQLNQFLPQSPHTDVLLKWKEEMEEMHTQAHVSDVDSFVIMNRTGELTNELETQELTSSFIMANEARRKSHLWSLSHKATPSTVSAQTIVTSVTSPTNSSNADGTATPPTLAPVSPTSPVTVSKKKQVAVSQSNTMNGTVRNKMRKILGYWASQVSGTAIQASDEKTMDEKAAEITSATLDSVSDNQVRRSKSETCIVEQDPSMNNNLNLNNNTTETENTNNVSHNSAHSLVVSNNTLPSMIHLSSPPVPMTPTEAARTIQRFYRLHRMKTHFRQIKEAVHIQQRRSMHDLYNESTVGRPASLSAPPHMTVTLQDSKQESQSTTLDPPIIVSEPPNLVLDGWRGKSVTSMVFYFNENPTKGMQRLIAAGIVNEDASAIASFLHKESRFNKSKIGEYLGELQHVEVLSAFVRQLDFSGLTFDQALRTLLRTFRLPGEAQKIDRVMMQFAYKYCQDNPTVFSNSDTAYILAFSLIMLNTDAHNRNVKTKMTLQDFIRNNRGIDNNQNLPEEFMKKLYQNITTNEIKMNDTEDDVSRVQDLSSRITAKPADLQLVSPSRHLVGQYAMLQINDIQKVDTVKHERSLFLFNDLVLITKPLRNRKFQYRCHFNLIQMTVIDLTDTQNYTNIIELNNINGRLIVLSLSSPGQKQAFIQALQEMINDVQMNEENKKRIPYLNDIFIFLGALREKTLHRAAAAKAALEKTYLLPSSSQDPLATPIEAMSPLVGPSPVPTNTESRYRKFASLRLARTAMQQERPAMPVFEPIKLEQPSPVPNSNVIPVSTPAAIVQEAPKTYASVVAASTKVVVKPVILVEKDVETKKGIEEESHWTTVFRPRQRSNTVTGYAISQIADRILKSDPSKPVINEPSPLTASASLSKVTGLQVTQQQSIQQQEASSVATGNNSSAQSSTQGSQFNMTRASTAPASYATQLSKLPAVMRQSSGSIVEKELDERGEIATRENLQHLSQRLQGS